MPVLSQTVEYRDGGTPLTGILFDDDADHKKRPGLLLVHHGAGLDDHAQTRARYYADQGFIVFACDMYGLGVAGNRERIMASLNAFRTSPLSLCRRAKAGLDRLTAHPRFDGRAAAIGYCFGGMTVLQMARSGMDLVGVVSVHGSLASISPAEPGAIKAKVLVCHGALDPHVPMAHVTAFADEMKQSGADWQFIMYGGAMHGFTHYAPSANPGVAYNADADRRSSIAINTFFHELLRPRESRAVAGF